MANRAYLVASDMSGTAGTTADGINYDPDSEILAAASTVIPVLWLSLFVEDDLQHHEVEGDRIATLVTSTVDAKKRLRSRLAFLKKALPDNAKQLAEWKQLVAGIPYRLVKVDGAEIWALEPNGFEATLTAAVRWFSSKADDDWQGLLAISDTAGDSTGNAFRFEDPPKHNLHGYRWVREVPWDDAEDTAPPKRPGAAAEVSIKPAILEKHPQLQAFLELDYFSHAGDPVEFDWAVSKGSDLLDAYLNCAHDSKWGMVKAFRAWPRALEWIRANVTVDAEQYYAQQKDEIDTACLQIYWNRIMPRLPRELRQYKVSPDLYFAWDLMHITIERELVSQGMPEGFCSKLLEVYEAGHLPCGWEGEYPAGKLIVH